MSLNVSESQRLETPLENQPYRLCANHPFDGWFVICPIIDIIFSMNDEEVFADFLNRILKEIKEYRTAVNRYDGDNKLVAEDLDRQISLLEKNLPGIKSEMDLFELSENDFLDMLQLVEDYLSVYIINDADTKQMKLQEKEYNQLLEILEWFYTDDDEDSEDEDETEGEE